MREKISGIYRIVCVKNGDYYYGSAQDLWYRWSTHKRMLKNNKHYNPRVQRTWNKYGEQHFRIELIENVSTEQLLEIEDKYLKEHVGKPHCMNISSEAFAPMRGRHHTLEARQKMSQQNMSQPSSRKGTSLPAEHLKNVRLFNSNRNKTECKRGHAFTDENTRRNKYGHRKCRVCECLANKARYQ